MKTVLSYSNILSLNELVVCALQRPIIATFNSQEM